MHVHINDRLKAQATEALEAMGLSVSDEVRIMLKRVVAEQAEPRRILEPFARAQLVGASSRGQTLQLLMNQTQVGKGLQMLILAASAELLPVFYRRCSN